MVAPVQRDTINAQIQSLHTTNAVVMVPPVDFQFNAETSADNEFQTPVTLSDREVKAKALLEFNQMVTLLRSHGVTVTVMDYSPSEAPTPDAVFPNNWFSTLPNGDTYLFPMACKNRRREVRPQALTEALKASGFKAPTFHHVGGLASPTTFLESTGVMIMDHSNLTVYGALSVRCDRRLFQEYVSQIGYKEAIYFDTKMSSGSPVYHTNVMMAVGEEFAVICDEIIEEFERHRVLTSLRKSKDVVSITEEQMASFCGNVLQLRNEEGERLIAMSLTAYNAFTLDQKRVLRRHGKLIPIDVTTIETIGGGSVRCMLAENFLPR